MSSHPAALLIDDHREISALFDRLDPALEAGDPGALLRQIDQLITRLGAHVRAEHLVLFEALRENRPPDGPPSEAELEERLTRLEEDHDFFLRELSLAIDLLKREAGHYEDEPLPGSVVSEVREHIDRVLRALEEHERVETEEVYEWLDGFLSGEERETVPQRFEVELEKAPARFSMEPGPEDG